MLRMGEQNDAGDEDDKTVNEGWNGSTKDWMTSTRRLRGGAVSNMVLPLAISCGRIRCPTSRTCMVQTGTTTVKVCGKCINDKDSHMAKGLWEVSSGFWNKEWHLKWRVQAV